MITIGSKMNSLLEYLDQILPDAKCELNYNKDYEFLIAVMLSAQTTDKRVNQITNILFSKYPSLNALSEANLKDIESILYPLGAYTKKAKNVKEIAINLLPIDSVPNDRKFLENLSGVGRKTTNVVLSTLYNEPYLAVDTHVSRVAKRLGFAKENDTPLVIEKKLLKYIPKERIGKTHHQLVLFGRYYCKSVKPECNDCKLKNICKKKKV